MTMLHQIKNININRDWKYKKIKSNGNYGAKKYNNWYKEDSLGLKNRYEMAEERINKLENGLIEIMQA